MVLTFTYITDEASTYFNNLPIFVVTSSNIKNTN